jgi:hypothetical protein
MRKTYPFEVWARVLATDHWFRIVSGCETASDAFAEAQADPDFHRFVGVSVVSSPDARPERRTGPSEGL